MGGRIERCPWHGRLTYLPNFHRSISFQESKAGDHKIEFLAKLELREEA